MAKCLYCQDRSGIISKVCKDCRQLIQSMKQLDENFGYRILLDTLMATGVDSEKIQRFLDADPDGTGSLNQQVTARMTNQLMGDLGQPSQMSAEDVKNVQKQVEKGESYLDQPDVVSHPKAEKDD